MRDHRKLEVFQLADRLVMEVYEQTRSFPGEELYGLVSQMRRSAVSVAANIVEGCELGYFIDLSGRLGYLSGDANTLLVESRRRASGALAALIGKRTGYRQNPPKTEAKTTR